MSLLAVLAASSTLLMQADDVGVAYVECMFNTARESGAHLTRDELSTLLRETCASQRGELQARVVSMRLQQGISIEQAESEFGRLESDSIASILRARRASTRHVNG